MNHIKNLAVSVALLFLVACGTGSEGIGSSQSALVTFDSATGTGFVGKGDVQLAFGWNNATLQKNANDLTFTYDATVTYDVSCEWTTGPAGKEKVHTVIHEKYGSISSAVEYEARRANQVNGFNLLGYDASGLVVTGDALPAVGDPCPGYPGNEKAVSDVEVVGTTGGLYVSHGSQTALLQ
jgi:hypothetical protein